MWIFGKRYYRCGKYAVNPDAEAESSLPKIAIFSQVQFLAKGVIVSIPAGADIDRSKNFL